MPALANLPPVSPAAPAAAPAAPEPVAEESFPSPFVELVGGQIPAVLVPPLRKEVEPDPLQEFVVGNLDKLLAAGLDYYEAKDLSTVLFNPKNLTEEQIAAADAAGTLAELAVPAAPAAAPGAAPEAAAPAPAAPAPAGPPPGTEQTMTRARLANLAAPRSTSAIKPDPIPQKLARRPV